MEFTVYQPPEIYGNDGQLIRQGAFGLNTPFYDPNGRGMYDYLVNNLEALQNGVGGAAQSASMATTKAALADAKAAEALAAKDAALAAKDAALAAKDAALAAQTGAETALAQAAAIATPDGLAARVLDIENAPHYFYDANGHLCLHYGSAGA